MNTHWFKIFIILIPYSILAQDFSWPEMDQASLGISIIDLRTGGSVVDHHADTRMTPASTLKIWTAAHALASLGPDYRAESILSYQGTIDQEGALDGSLHFLSSGDPSWHSRHLLDSELDDWFIPWGEILKKSAIRCVSQPVYIHLPWSESERYLPRYVWQDVANYYGSGGAPLSYQDNAVVIEWNLNKKLGELADIISIQPAQLSDRFRSEVTIGDRGSGDQSYIYPEPGFTTYLIKGSIAQGRKKNITRGAHPDPIRRWYQELIKKAASIGLELPDAFIIELDKPVDTEIISRLHSMPLQRLLQIMMDESDNAYAEIIARWSEQKLSRSDWLAGILADDATLLYDGSGLSPANAISPHQMTRVLAAAHQTHPEALDACLIPSGTSSLAGLFNNLPAGYTVRAKSGSMAHVRCYAGIIYYQNNPRYAFSFMANHFSGAGRPIAIQMDRYLKSFLKKN